ncbi:MAG: FHA domain-containing protein [Woeseiaceae bacterium]
MTSEEKLIVNEPEIAFFEGRQQKELVAELERVYHQRNGLALIEAPAGAGVSSLVRHLSATLKAGDPALEGLSFAIIDAADNTVGGFLVEVLAAFGYQLDDARHSELLSLMTMICQHQAIAGVPPLIVVKHVDQAHPNTLRTINQLAGLKHQNQSVCRLILSGGEQLKDIATAERMAEVGKRVCAELKLEPMDESELRQFVAHVLADQNLVAHESAIDSLVRLSKGFPGEIIRAIDYARRDVSGDESLSSGDMLLAIESAMPADAERPVTPSETTQIQKITMEDNAVFDEGTGRHTQQEPAPLGEILVNCNGELLKRYVISRRKVLIGRAPHNDIVLESRWVSRHHAILICTPDSASLADVNSTNGLTLNSRELRQGNLRNNDIIVIGDFRLKYVNANAQPQPEDRETLSETRVLRSLSVSDLGNDVDATEHTPKTSEDNA